MTESRGSLEAAAEKWNKHLLAPITSRLISGRLWHVKCGIAVATLSAFVQAPAAGPHASDTWQTVVRQSTDLFGPLGAAPGSHNSKLTFRLVPPLLVGIANLTPVLYYLLQLGLAVVAFALLVLLFERVGFARGEALALTAAIGLTGAGSLWFTDTWPVFDAIALTALVVALYVRNPLTVFSVATIACWTDERALLGALVVATFHVTRKQRWSAVAAVAAVVGYGVLRLLLTVRYDLVVDREFIGLDVLRPNHLTRPTALFSTIEALWFLVALGILAGICRRELSAWVLGALTAASTVGAVMVYDVTRSVAYLLPAIVLSLSYLAAEPDKIRRPLVYGATAMCLVIPSATIIASELNVILPLPMQIAKWV